MQKAMAAMWVSLVLAVPASAQQVLKVAVNDASRQYQPALTALYKEVGLVPEFVVLPYERALKSVESGDVDADLGRVAGGTAGYQNMIELHEPVTEVSLIAVVRKDSRVVQLSVSDLKGYSVGTLRGAKMAEALAAKLGMRLVLVNTQQQMYQMLEHGRFEIALTTSTAMPGPDLAAKVRTLPPLQTASAVHVLHKKWAAWAPKLDAALKTMKADGRWAKLMAQP